MSDKWAVVTGASSGIGRAVAIRLERLARKITCAPGFLNRAMVALAGLAPEAISMRVATSINARTSRS